MRRSRVLVVGLFAGGLGLASATAGWRDAALPPDAEQLNRTADHAASAATAARLYVQSLKLAPDNGPALYGLGRALLDEDRPAEALRVFRRLAKLFPGEADVLEALAAAIARQPDLRRADVAEGRALADQAAQLRPDRPEAWHVLSVLCHLDGDYAAAAAAARRAVELDAQNPSDPETTASYLQQEIACNDALTVFSPLD